MKVEKQPITIDYARPHTADEAAMSMRRLACFLAVLAMFWVLDGVLWPWALGAGWFWRSIGWETLFAFAPIDLFQESETGT
jgi:hypothetical protein